MQQNMKRRNENLLNVDNMLVQRYFFANKNYRFNMGLTIAVYLKINESFPKVK